MVIATGSGVTNRSRSSVWTIFEGFQEPRKINILNVSNRRMLVNNVENLEMVKKAALVFFTGGDQLRITAFWEVPLYIIASLKCCEEGCVFVGISRSFCYE